MPRQIVRHVTAAGAVRVGVRLAQLPHLVHPVAAPTIAELLQLSRAELDGVVDESLAAPAEPLGRLLPPVDGLTEVWASGVTYLRSNEARQQESQVADVYARVYLADRPELFFKSQAWRVCGDGEPIGIRADSEIDVPEPELALVCNSVGEIVGLTVCDDVSSRAIEGDNPLYLPQAKIYSGSCSVGSGIVPIGDVTDPYALDITVTVTRGAAVVWDGTTSTANLRRDFDVLLEYLFRQSTFPAGVLLSTGTGLVPELDFTLVPGDVVRVDVDGVGTLTNPVRPAADFGWLTPAATREP